MEFLTAFWSGLEPTLSITRLSAIWLFPLSLPICFWAAWSDMRAMRIPNYSVLALALIFVLIGPFLMPLPEFGARLVQLVVVLLVGIILNAGGLVGAGDAKFAAAAAPYIALGDLRFVLALFAATLLGAFTTHRLARRSPLRKLAPDWESWTRQRDFPMGLALGCALSIYLGLGIVYGS